jgi:hypothetical protein
MTDLKSIEINPNCTLASFDISNMYINVSTDHLKYIIENGLKNNTTEIQHIQEILTIYDLIVKRNYFSNNKQFWQQKKTGLAMGAPYSGLLSEIFLNTSK